MNESDRALADVIVAAEPVLGMPATPLAKADALLRWASGAMAWCNEVPADFDELSPGEKVRCYFAPRAGGVLCGGMSRFFGELLDLFDVRSVILQCGFADGVNHVTVLVPCQGKFYLFDPMFSATYRPAESWDFLDFASVLGGEPFVLRCHRAAPAILRRANDVAGTKQRWASRNVTANWAPEPNEHGWVVAHVTSFDRLHRLIALPEDLAKIGISPDDDLLSALIRRHVFSLARTDKDVADCAAMLAAAGCRIDPADRAG